MTRTLHALTLATALLLAGCAAASPTALQHGADHPAAPQASAAPHHTNGDALPEAVEVHAPSGLAAEHHGHEGHGHMDHTGMSHAPHGAHDGAACTMGCCEDGRCGMACCAGDYAGHEGHGAHHEGGDTTGCCEDGRCGMACCAEGGTCGGHEGHAGHAHVDLSHPASPPHQHQAHADPVELSDDDARALHQALDAYLTISDRLSNDSVDGLADAARALESAAGLLARSDALRGHAEHLGVVRTQAAALAQTTALPGARSAFGEMGPAFAHVVGAAGVPEGMGVTRFVCGMADAPQGGVWLQRSGEPRNPYFGAAMLRCQRSQEVL